MNRALDRAREKGYLKNSPGGRLQSEYNGWCWRLKIPIIWMERCSPRSRFGRLHLDLFTTPRSLNAAGRQALLALGARFQTRADPVVSSHDAHWDRVPFGQLESLAQAVLRVANLPANYCIEDAPATAAFPKRAVA